MFEKHLLDICNQREEKSIHFLKLNAFFTELIYLSLIWGVWKLVKAYLELQNSYIYAFNLQLSPKTLLE